MKELSKFYTVRGYQLLEQNKKLLTSAMEDYLEMIYRSSPVKGTIRISVLAELLNVAPPSATKMVQKLNKLGMLDYEKYGELTLTDIGKEIGKYLLDRHHILEQFLGNLGVRENILIETELIEHNISAETLHLFHKFNRFIAQNPKFAEEFLRYAKEKDE